MKTYMQERRKNTVLYKQELNAKKLSRQDPNFRKKENQEHIAPIITRADGLCVKLSRRAFCRVSEGTDEVVCIVAPYRTSFLCIINCQTQSCLRAQIDCQKAYQNTRQIAIQSTCQNKFYERVQSSVNRPLIFCLKQASLEYCIAIYSPLLAEKSMSKDRNSAKNHQTQTKVKFNHIKPG
jgi:hypothetical protein